MSGGLREDPFAHPFLTFAAGVDEYAVKTPGVLTQLSHLRSHQSRVMIDEIADFDVIHLHWIEGFLNSRDLDRILSRGQKIVWTIHDMRPFTGACHHAGSCTGFAQDCSNCPQARPPFRKSVELNLTKRVGILEQGKNKISFVSPSNWLADLAAKSTLVKGSPLRVIGNPINSIFFELVDKRIARQRLQIDEQSLVITIVAKNLDDPNKQVQEMFDQFEKFASKSNSRAQLLLVGDGGGDLRTNPLVRKLGNLEPASLRDVYCATNLILSGSLAESFGLTLAEAGALGVPSLTSIGHAASEGLVDGLNGFTFAEVSQLPEKLSEIFALSEEEFSKIGSNASQHFTNTSHPSTVSKSYAKLYEEVLR
jgi:glycosyltransferase involved in cell wall biosynthesis